MRGQHPAAIEHSARPQTRRRSSCLRMQIFRCCKPSALEKRDASTWIRHEREKDGKGREGHFCPYSCIKSIFFEGGGTTCPIARKRPSPEATLSSPSCHPSLGCAFLRDDIVSGTFALFSSQNSLDIIMMTCSRRINALEMTKRRGGEISRKRDEKFKTWFVWNIKVSRYTVCFSFFFFRCIKNIKNSLKFFFAHVAKVGELFLMRFRFIRRAIKITSPPENGISLFYPRLSRFSLSHVVLASAHS